MNPEELARLEAVEAALGGKDSLAKWNAEGNNLILGFTNEQAKRQKFAEALSSALDNAATRVRASGSTNPSAMADALEQAASTIRSQLLVTH
ncbi:MAG: hypothetical protein ACRDHF_10400 [Tepidiformaceae bacterium]